MFQFHEGPIKTPPTAPKTPTEASFNSMKVRLKHGYLNGKPVSSLFQFHEGPIKTST